MTNDILTHYDLALQRQCLLSEFGGAINNLLAMAPPGKAFEADIDSILTDGVAKILRTSKKGLGYTGLADLRILPALAQLVRTYERFRLHAIRHGGPAAELMRVIHGDAKPPTTPGAQRENRLRSWCASYYATLRRLGFDPAWTMSFDPNETTAYHIKARAASLAARAAYMPWLARVRKYVAAREAHIALKPSRALKTLSQTHFAIRMSSMDTPVAMLPAPTMYRPSAYGAGIGGPIIGRCRKSHAIFVALFRARLGREGLFVWPFWPIPRAEKKARRDTVIHGRGPAAMAQRAVRKAQKLAAAAKAKDDVDKCNDATRRKTRCNLCNAHGGDLVHLCTECPATAHRRALAYGGGLWTAAVLRIADALYAAHKRGPPPTVLRNAINAIVMPSPEWALITTHIITSSPWPKSSALPAWEATARLGHMFDKDMPDHGAAHLADAWATEAHTHSLHQQL